MLINSIDIGESKKKKEGLSLSLQISLNEGIDQVKRDTNNFLINFCNQFCYPYTTAEFKTFYKAIFLNLTRFSLKIT